MASEAGLWFQQKGILDILQMEWNRITLEMGSEVAIPVENIVGSARFIS